MEALLQRIVEPLQYEFMRNGLAQVVLLGIAAGTVGAFVFLRGLTFFAHALSHTVFPGLVAALALGINPLLGGAAAALLTALVVGALTRRRHVAHDSAIAIAFITLFALGVIMVGLARTRSTSLGQLLVGNILAVGREDLLLTGGVTLLALAVLALCYKELLLASFDPTVARALGLPLGRLDLLLLLLIALTAVVAVRAVGVILVVAMLVTPAATARLLANRLPAMMALGALIAAASGIVGLYAADLFQVAPGGTIVVTATLVFAVVWLLSPRGALAGRAPRFPRPRNSGG